MLQYLRLIVRIARSNWQTQAADVIRTLELSRVPASLARMSWFYLLLAGMAEIGWALCLKSTAGWTRFGPSVLTLALLAVSMALLSVAVKTLPIGSAYAVWTGIGAVGTAVAGILFLGESRDPVRLVCIGLIVAGVAGLRIFAR